MRRSEKESRDTALFNRIMEAEVGYLGITLTNGFPRVVPVNFVGDEEEILFHGARSGEKYDVLKDSAQVNFSVSIPLALIPESWVGKGGCGANHYYVSVSLYGTCSLVTVYDAKEKGLLDLSVKYLPDLDVERVKSEEKWPTSVEKTALFRIEVEHFTTKVNVGQSQEKELTERIVSKLEERNEPVDKLTVELMRLF